MHSNITYSIAKRSTISSFILISRQIVVQLLNFGGNLLVARLLSIEDYGLIGIFNYFFLFLLNFGDIGLGASIIHSQEETPSLKLNAVFTLQLLLTVFFVVVFLMTSPFIGTHYKLPRSFSGAFILIALSFIINTFKIIPQVKLERHLNFKALAITEIAQAFIFNGLMVFMVLRGFGAISLCWALLARTLIGGAIIFLLGKWPIGLSFNFSLIIPELKFGLPLQLSQLINLLKDSISPIIAGTIIGTRATGIINMASLIATIPTMLLFIMNRIYFPAFARSRGEAILTNKLFRSFMVASNAFVGIISMFLLGFFPSIVHFVWGDKWLSTNPLFYYLWTANLFIPTFSICQQFLNSRGETKINMLFSIWGTLATLIGGTILLKHHGIIGFGIINIVINLSMCVLIIYSYKLVSLSGLYGLLTWVPPIITLIIMNLFCPIIKVLTISQFMIQSAIYFFISIVGVLLLFRNDFSQFAMLKQDE